MQRVPRVPEWGRGGGWVTANLQLSSKYLPNAVIFSNSANFPNSVVIQSACPKAIVDCENCNPQYDRTQIERVAVCRLVL